LVVYGAVIAAVLFFGRALRTKHAPARTHINTPSTPLKTINATLLKKPLKRKPSKPRTRPKVDLAPVADRRQHKRLAAAVHGAVLA
jgi:hypothetical protein